MYLESTANVEYDLNEFQQCWGEQYVLVTTDGLLESDSDSDELTSKKVKDDIANRLKRIESNVEDLLQEVDSIKTSTNNVLHLNEQLKVPLGLQRHMRDAFQCKICLCILSNPLVIISKFCMSILGCERCVNG